MFRSISCVSVLVFDIVQNTKNYTKADIKYLVRTTMSLSQDIYIYPM